jgi:probable phosphoglycerate mutase
MKRVLLIRHALPHEGHARWPGDPPLHLDGRRHAQRLARRLAREGIDRIACSPQRRALETAAPTVRLLGLQPVIHQGLAEVDHGTPRYRSVETLRAEEPVRFAEFLASPPRFFGKDPLDYRRRVLEALEAVLADQQSRCIAVFSHGMTIKTILCAALGVEATIGRFSIDHGSVSRLSGPAIERLRVDSVNESLCKAAK